MKTITNWARIAKSRYEAMKALAELHEKEGKTGLYDFKMSDFLRNFKIDKMKYYEKKSETYDPKRGNL